MSVADGLTRVDSAARELLEAEQRAAARDPLSDSWPELDVATGYRVQDRTLELRRERGEVVVGVKLGFTSRAKQAQMGIDEPISAWLTDAMALPASGRIPTDALIHARAEPELAFVLGRRLRGPGVTSAAALAAVERVHAAVEIIDSRYEQFRFTLADVVADNASSAGFLLGAAGRRPEALDLSLEACLLEVDGTVVASATGAAVMGDPAQALAECANALARRGHGLEPGWIVLTGGLTEAVPIQGGATVRAAFTNLGNVTFSTRLD